MVELNILHRQFVRSNRGKQYLIIILSMKGRDEKWLGCPLWSS